MNNRKSMVVTIIALIVAVLGLTVAYAALSTTLNVKFGNVVQQAASWNVAFDTTNATIQPETYSSSTTGFSCGTASVTATTVTMGNSTLSKPGDRCEWEVAIKNTGTLNAKLATIVTTAPSGETCTGTNTGVLTCGNIDYYLRVTYTEDEALADTSDAVRYPLKQNAVLNSSDDVTLTLTAEYNKADLTNSESKTHSNVAFTLNWVQN